jgi:hypothetical protein
MKGLTARSDRSESCTIRLAEVRTFTAVLKKYLDLTFFKEIKVLSPLITKLSNFSVGIMVVCESLFPLGLHGFLYNSVLFHRSKRAQPAVMNSIQESSQPLLKPKSCTVFGFIIEQK